MYIKLVIDSWCWQHGLFAANHKMVYLSENLWDDKSEAIRAAKKLARRVGINYKGEKDYYE